MKKIIFLSAIILINLPVFAQIQIKASENEIYTPVPSKVTPANGLLRAPSDALILFDGKNMDEWEQEKNPSSNLKWDLIDNAMRVNKKNGDLKTKKSFLDYQLHIEYLIPATIVGSGQARGNSGIFLAALPGSISKAGGYELQVLDNYENKTYVNGQAGSLYKQSPPLVNACLAPGEWQSYDIAWTAPKFNEEGSLKSPAHVTVFHNGILIQLNYELLGDTPYDWTPSYKKHGASPIKLQAHGDPSEPISYRNIWIRPL